MFKRNFKLIQDKQFMKFGRIQRVINVISGHF